MQIKQRIHNGTLYIMLEGELDEHVSIYTRTTLDKLFEKINFAQVIIDLSGLSFMDSTGIGVLIGRYKKLKSKNVPIYICNPNNHIEKIFKIAGLYEIMPKIS